MTNFEGGGMRLS